MPGSRAVAGETLNRGLIVPDLLSLQRWPAMGGGPEGARESWCHSLGLPGGGVRASRARALPRHFAHPCLLGVA